MAILMMMCIQTSYMCHGLIFIRMNFLKPRNWYARSDVCPVSFGYQRRDTTMGDTLILWCGTMQSSGVKWTRNTTAGYFNVYINGSITSYQNFRGKFSVVSPREGEYNLRIYNVHHTDSGFYDCYETNERRIIGYDLVVKSMFFSSKALYNISITFMYTLMSCIVILSAVC